MQTFSTLSIRKTVLHRSTLTQLYTTKMMSKWSVVVSVIVIITLMSSVNAGDIFGGADLIEDFIRPIMSTLCQIPMAGNYIAAIANSISFALDKMSKYYFVFCVFGIAIAFLASTANAGEIAKQVVKPFCRFAIVEEILNGLGKLIGISELCSKSY
uniref:Uncharacterized protein n=1 Tax=Strigamia maritima TaxID=126957 RepID=T1IT63_STRMM